MEAKENAFVSRFIILRLNVSDIFRKDLWMGRIMNGVTADVWSEVNQSFCCAKIPKIHLNLTFSKLNEIDSYLVNAVAQYVRVN